MKKSAARLAAVLLGVVVGGRAVATAAMLLPPDPLGDALHVATEQVLPGVEKELEEAGPARNARVLAEIARLGAHPWAGVYRTAGMSPVELAIAPETGFTLYRRSGCGNCARYASVGTVLGAEGSTLKLRVELQEQDDTSAAWYGLDDTLYLVPWGELVFAVARSRMELFCAEFSGGLTFPYVPFEALGQTPEKYSLGGPRPAGKPKVPREFEHLLLDVPISARVVELVDWRRRPELDRNDKQAYDAVYSVDVGSDQGLAVGMHFSVERGRYAGRFSGRVEHVERTTGRFQLLAYEGRAWAEGLVGKTATTLRPKPLEK
jgi:hypothetical protein